MKKLVLFILVTLVALVVTVSIVTVNYFNNNSQTLNQEPLEFTIEKGSSAYNVGAKLESEGFIVDDLIFKVHLKMNEHLSSFQAGTYQINETEEMVSLLKRFNEGDSIVIENTKVTFQEGLTTKEVLALIEAKTGISAAEVLSYAQSVSDNYWFLSDIPKDDTFLDGFLFPDTYEFTNQATVQEVIGKMLDNTAKKVEPLKEDMLNSKFTVRELFTLSSLIEKEALHDKDRPMISGIIYNRLEDDMLLQIDATVLAVIGHKQTVTYEDLKVDSPYNTYKYKGLPPSPIAMPGITSLEASLNPVKHDYIYYVADRETGYHHFAVTFKEHEENIANYWKKK